MIIHYISHVSHIKTLRFISGSGVSVEFFWHSDTLQDAICAICLEIMVEPRKMSGCTHHFCKGCIERWVEEAPMDEDSDDDPKCPTCRQTGNPVAATSQMRAVIRWLPCKCFYHPMGCEERIPFGHVVLDARACSYRPAPCDKYCGEMVSVRNMATHLLTCPRNGDALTASLMCYRCRHSYQLGGRPSHCDYYRLAENIQNGHA